jgi:hypothetical protein
VAAYLAGVRVHVGVAMAFPNPLSYVRLTWAHQRVRIQAMSGTLPIMDTVWLWYSRREGCGMPEGYRNCLCRQTEPETLQHLARCGLYHPLELFPLVGRYVTPDAWATPRNGRPVDKPAEVLRRALGEPGLQAAILAGVLPQALVGPLRDATREWVPAASTLLAYGVRELAVRMEIRRDVIGDHLRRQPRPDMAHEESLQAHMDMLHYQAAPHVPRVPTGGPQRYPVMASPGAGFPLGGGQGHRRGRRLA